MKNLKTRIAALLMISLLAITLAPTASAIRSDGPCDGAAGLANCAATQAGCIVYYALYLHDRCHATAPNTTASAGIGGVGIEVGAEETA